MPGADHYADMTLAEAVEELANVHYDPRTRHISHVEYEILARAAEELRR